MHDAYACNNLTIAERIEEAWMPVVFLRLWRKWLKIEKFDVSSNFISDQTYRDTTISGYSLILAAKVLLSTILKLHLRPGCLAAINAKNCLRKYDVFKERKQM